MSNFVFLRAEWPDIYEAATKAEGLVYHDPRSGCFMRDVGWSWPSHGSTAATAR